MAQTPSNMVPLGTTAPDFNLLDVQTGATISLKAIAAGKPIVVMFICNHCPFVIHINEELVRLSREYISKGISFAAISSNDAATYPQDGPDRMKEHAERLGYPFPYLYDESQDIARAYDAACTPDFYVFDSNCKLVYRGQLDDSRPSNQLPVNGKDLRMALDQVLKGLPPITMQKPSIGCNIKWKK